jgi:hypothetical protein
VDDVALRNVTYRLFVDLGGAPTAPEVAREADTGVDGVRDAWTRLHDAHALVVDDVTGEIRMAPPFSAVPTVHRVQAAGRSWFANCAWDAFGICAALGSDGRIQTSCPDCGEGLAIGVTGSRPGRSDLLFHCLVPAAQWWDDIAFT